MPRSHPRPQRRRSAATQSITPNDPVPNLRMGPFPSFVRNEELATIESSFSLSFAEVQPLIFLTERTLNCKRSDR
jgi:hypothetical protein